MTGLALEAALGRGEAEMRAGRTQSGRARLARTEREARARGYLAIANEAATLAAAR
jgi:hypothetical protein